MADKQIECPDCGGEGIVDDEICSTCEGEGVVPVKMGEASQPYFKRLHALLKERVQGFLSESDFMEMTKKARGHAGGVAKAKKMKSMNASGWRWFNECQFAEPPAWVQIFPKPGKYVHPEYGEIDLTDATLKRIIRNFQEANYQGKLPIDTEHNEKKLKEGGAFGWIEGLRQAADGSVEAQTKWTDLGAEAIRNDRYRYISADWLPKFTDPQGNEFRDVLRGAALCVRPFFKDKYMRPIVATEAGVFAISDKAIAGYTRVVKSQDGAIYFTALEPSTEVKAMAEEKTAPKAGMSEDEARQFGELQTQVGTLLTENATLKAANEQATAKLTEATEDNKTLAERVEKMEKDARARRFAEIVKDFTGKADDHIGFMESLAEKFGEDSKEFKHYVEREKATAEQLRKSNLFSELGSDAEGRTQTALDKMNAEAKKLCEADKSLSFPQAFAKVMDQQPQLYREYEAEREGRAN